MKPLVALLSLAATGMAAATEKPTPPSPATDIGACAVVQWIHSAQDMVKRTQMIQAAGIGLSRTGFVWRVVEKTRGTYDFSEHDTVVRIADSHGLSLYGILSHTPKWAAPITDHLDEWLAFVETTVKRYPQVRYWEVFNEPNLESFWGSKPDAVGYARLLRLTYAKIKSIDPSLFVTSGGLAGGNNASGGYAGKYAETLFEQGIAGSFDAFAIHPYRYPHAPEETHHPRTRWIPDKSTMEQALGKYLALMAAHRCADKPLWISECGYTAFPGEMLSPGERVGSGKNIGVTDQEQADFLPRSILLSFQYGASSWMWYTTITSERNPNDREQWFGIIHPNYEPRPAYHALKALRRAYPAGSVLLKDRYLKAPFYRLAWQRPDGKTGWAIWTAERDATKDCILSLRGEVRDCYDALGEPVALKIESGRAKTSLSGRVLYIIGPESVAFVP